MIKVRLAVVGALVAAMSLLPSLGAPAYATHACGFEPCPHVEDVLPFVCEKVPLLSKVFQKFSFCQQ